MDALSKIVVKFLEKVTRDKKGGGKEGLANPANLRPEDLDSKALKTKTAKKLISFGPS